jgi:hypothetical protein
MTITDNGMLYVVLYVPELTCDPSPRKVLEPAKEQCKQQHTRNATESSYPNYMIPVWKSRMFARADNLTEPGILEFLTATNDGLAYKLIAYQVY